MWRELFPSPAVDTSVLSEAADPCVGYWPHTTSTLDEEPRPLPWQLATTLHPLRPLSPTSTQYTAGSTHTVSTRAQSTSQVTWPTYPRTRRHPNKQLPLPRIRAKRPRQRRAVDHLLAAPVLFTPGPLISMNPTPRATMQERTYRDGRAHTNQTVAHARGARVVGDDVGVLARDDDAVAGWADAGRRGCGGGGGGGGGVGVEGDGEGSGCREGEGEELGEHFGGGIGFGYGFDGSLGLGTTFWWTSMGIYTRQSRVRIFFKVYMLVALTKVPCRRRPPGKADRL